VPLFSMPFNETKGMSLPQKIAQQSRRMKIIQDKIASWGISGDLPLGRVPSFCSSL